MAISFALVERTPYTLRWLATSDGGQDDPNIGTIDEVVLAAAALVAGEPIHRLVTTDVLSTAGAQQLLNGDGLTVGGTDANQTTRLRGRLSVMPRTTPGAAAASWAVNADVNNDRAVITVVAPVAAGAAYIELHARHSVER